MPRAASSVAPSPISCSSTALDASPPCSKACQAKDWKKQQEICKLLNKGHGHAGGLIHERLSIDMKDQSKDMNTVLTTPASYSSNSSGIDVRRVSRGAKDENDCQMADQA
jgi:hypothetical protein